MFDSIGDDSMWEESGRRGGGASGLNDSAREGKLARGSICTDEEGLACCDIVRWDSADKSAT